MAKCSVIACKNGHSRTKDQRLMGYLGRKRMNTNKVINEGLRQSIFIAQVHFNFLFFDLTVSLVVFIIYFASPLGESFHFV